MPCQMQTLKVQNQSVKKFAELAAHFLNSCEASPLCCCRLHTCGVRGWPVLQRDSHPDHCSYGGRCGGAVSWLVHVELWLLLKPASKQNW